MGLSSNQARFLSLTSRQVDLEQRVQQICQRRLRLSSELERVATDYNNQIGNRKMFTSNLVNQGISDLSLSNLKTLGYKVVNNITNKPVGNNFMKKINQMSEVEALAAGYTTIHNATELTTLVNADLNGKYMLMDDIDMSSITLLTNAITGHFTGTFDGNGNTVRNLNIDTSSIIPDGSNDLNAGLFAIVDGGTIRNLSVEDASINASNFRNVGIIAGGSYNGSTIDNCYASGSVSANFWAGGILGVNVESGIVSNSSADVTVEAFAQGAGGIVGANCNGDAVISNCYADGSVIGPTGVGGIAGINRNSGAIIENCYSNADVTSTTVTTGIGGLVGTNTIQGLGFGNVDPLILNSYSANCIVTDGGGVTGSTTDPLAASSSFYYNNGLSSDAAGATNGINTTGWDANIWDLSGTLPVLKKTGGDSSIIDLEEGLRSGKYSLAEKADEFTQSPIDCNGESYEKVDWRTVPSLNDELFKGDDVDAENKYDRTIAQINSQDKKLQLEQSSVEVAYKAISSEKEAVKKILDANSSSSFKYFS